MSPIDGSKKISSSQPFAASGERRIGTMTSIAMRTIHSAAKKRLSQSGLSANSACILRFPATDDRRHSSA